MGANKFINSLYDLFEVLEKSEQKFFGIFLSYWLAKFYGYKLKENKYLYSFDLDWSELFERQAFILDSNQIQAKDWDTFLFENQESINIIPLKNNELTGSFEHLLKNRINNVRMVWEESRKEIEKNWT